MAHSSFVTETSVDSFQEDVFERSHNALVLLDFWAAWCAPCRQLGPILERVAEALEGKMVVVKADVDQLPQQAGEFNVSTIPAVFAVRDGEVVDAFQGLLPEEQLTAWVQRLLPSPARQLVKQALERLVADPSSAESLLQQAIEMEPNLAEAKIELARLKANQGNDSEALAIIKALEERGFLEQDAQVIKAEITLRQQMQSPEEISRLRETVENEPNNGEAKLTLATALLASQEYEEGLQLCLSVVEYYRPLREQAREVMVETFRVLGEESPLTASFRRKLALALY